MASGCARSRRPYANVDNAWVDSHREQVATSDGGRARPVAHIKPAAALTLASAFALVRTNRISWLIRGRPSVSATTGPSSVTFRAVGVSAGSPGQVP